MEGNRCNKGQTCVLVTIFLAFFVTAFSTYTTVISAKNIALELQMDAATLSWVSTIFILAAALFQIPFGKIGDIYGRKKVFLAGTILFTLASILLAFSYSSLSFIFFRFLQGSGAALIFATGNAILTASFPPKDRGKVLGISVTGVYIGLTLSPILGGIMTDNIGWRCQSWFNVPFGLLIAGLVIFKVRGDWKSEKEEKLDPFGTVMFMVFLFSLIFSLSIFPDPLGFLFLTVFIVAIIIFFVWEKNNSNPLLNLNLFKGNRFLTLSSASELAFYASTIALNLLLSLFMQYLKRLSPQEAGFVLVVQPLMMALFSPLAGKFSSRMEAKRLVSIGIGISSIGIVLLLFIDINFPIFSIAIAFGIIGVGTAFFASPNIRAIMDSVPRDALGIAAGLEGTMRTIGQSLSFGAVTFVFTLILGKVDITPAYYNLFLLCTRLICALFLVIIILSLILSILRGRTSEFK
ncbi:MAG: MFS transporter [Candidatus Lokiarchaeota archaeon]|nr:MFS transporter [Candidatus Lokiarchaeota archaeon]